MVAISIDADAMRIIKVAKTEEEATLWAELLHPFSSIAVTNEKRKTYSLFSREEIVLLLKNTYNIKISGGSYQQLLMYACDRLQTHEADPTSAEVLLKRLGRESGALPPAERGAAIVPKADKPVQEHVRPNTGTVTGQVWQICDETDAEFPELVDKEFRGKVVELCVEKGINKATATTQYAKWKKRK